MRVGWKLRCTVEGKALGGKSLDPTKLLAIIRKSLQDEGYDVVALELLRQQDIDSSTPKVREKSKRRYP